MAKKMLQQQELQLQQQSQAQPQLFISPNTPANNNNEEIINNNIGLSISSTSIASAISMRRFYCFLLFLYFSIYYNVLPLSN